MMRRYVAEFVGTFAIVFAPMALSGTGTLPGGNGSLLAAALVSGFSVAAMVYALGPLSAAHFNPAVTVGFALAKRFPFRFVVPYCAAQVLGSIAAAGLCAWLFGAGYGTHVPAHGAALQAALLEAVLTFFLMLVIMAVATDRRVDGAVPGLAIGLIVVVDVLIGGPVSGGSMNPARSFGPALFAAGGTAWHFFPVYVVGPVVGAAIAACLYEALRPSREHAQNAPNDLFAALEDVQRERG